MTSRSRRPAQALGLLKAALVAGSLAATLIGTRLLAANDARPAGMDNSVLQPAVVEMAPAQAFTRPGGQVITIQLDPIPRAAQATLPAVTRSRSSR